MMYLVAYDISDTKIRTKIAHYLEGKGIRIQKSVFMLDVNKNKIVPIMQTLKKLRKQDGVIHVISVCRLCWQKSYVTGQETPENFFFFS